MSYRTITNRWYSSRRWKAKRERQLHDEPLCWMCRDEGHIIPASVADHDPPHKGDEAAFWNGPLRSLCKRHHDSDKAMIEAGKAPRPKFDAKGRPVWS